MRRRQSLWIVAVSTLAAVAQAGPAGAARSGAVAGSAAVAVTSLCPSATPGYDDIGDLMQTLDARAVSRSSTTGMSTVIDAASGGEAFRHWRYRADPRSGRSSWGFRADGENGLEGERAGYEDVVAHRRYRLVTWAGPPTRMESAALKDFGRSSIWLRIASTRDDTWPLRGYLDLAQTYAIKIRTEIPGATFTCTDDGTVLTIVAAGASDTRTLTLTVDATRAPVAYTLTGGGESTWQWTGSITYARPSLTPPSGSVTGTTFRIAATRQMVRDLRDLYVKPAAKNPVAKATTHAARVAALRAAATSANARFVKDYNVGGSTEVTSTGKNVTNGRRYVVRCGTAAGSVTFTVKGTKVVTTSTVPKLP
jgi:hypothetical protein